MTMSGRKDWVQADLRCLMCGHVLGRLVGPLPADQVGRSMAGGVPRFAAFRPADGSAPMLRLSGTAQFRCRPCGRRPS